MMAFWTRDGTPGAENGHPIRRLPFLDFGQNWQELTERIAKPAFHAKGQHIQRAGRAKPIVADDQIIVARGGIDLDDTRRLGEKHTLKEDAAETKNYLRRPGIGIARSGHGPVGFDLPQEQIGEAAEQVSML